MDTLPATELKPKGWLNRNILGMGLTSQFSDMNHEMASADLPNTGFAAAGALAPFSAEPLSLLRFAKPAMGNRPNVKETLP